MAHPAATIRLALPADSTGIAEAHVASWQATYPGIVPQPILDRLSVERRAAYWRETITRSLDAATDIGERVWVAEAASPRGRILGFAATGPGRDDDVDAGTGELNAIYLAPDAWSRGIGRMLFAAAVDDLAVRHERLVLWVLSDNDRGRTFYEQAGWEPDGTLRVLDFDGSPIEEMRYRRR
jgi:GNAT superfamily N-acetyltransferase